MVMLMGALTCTSLWLLHVTILLFSCCIMHSSSQAPSAPASANTTDHLALLSFKSLVSQDPSQALASWNDTASFCQWRGVTCGGRRHPQRVTSLELGALNLTGSISPSLANLTFLRQLNLSNNAFQGHIPQELGRLSRLRHLILRDNFLGGGVPDSLGRCSKLQIIDLSHNMLRGGFPGNLTSCQDLRVIYFKNNVLEGGIPAQLGSLPKLYFLDLSSNSLVGGIPPSLGNLSFLTNLDLSQNDLVGSIPVELGRLGTLGFLNVGFNRLAGEVPSSIYNLSSIYTLVVANNQLTGTLPSNLGVALPRLQHLLVYGNQLHGPIPPSLANASRLAKIELHDNNFSGVLPSGLGNLQYLSWLQLGDNRLQTNGADDWSLLISLTNCSQLQVLDLRACGLSGFLPNSIGNLSTRLYWLSLGRNEISGNIPSETGNLVNLTILYLHQNLLTGTIPDSIGKLQRLHILLLAANKLSGEIPSSIGNLTQLNRLHLFMNGLEGNIPTTLGDCQDLELLDLSYNNLTGSIPQEVLSISSISSLLNLSHNSLSGSLPQEVGNLINLKVLDISENRLSNEIPSSLGDCQLLEFLYMEGNLFEGQIPATLGNLKGIQELDLSRNSLSGFIPKFLQNLQALKYINLSFNNFEGEVPTQLIFGNVSAFSILGNRRLCGGDPRLNLPICPIQGSRRRHSSLVLKVTVPVAIVGACLASALLFYMIHYHIVQKRTHRTQPTTSSDDQFNQLTKITYPELHRATGGFALANLIGVGSFGSVYKGVLDGDGKIIAVKVLNLQHQGALKTFNAECKALRNIRHHNLVKVITSCSSVDFRGNDFKALVFEYMPNGSLDMWLHPELYRNRQLSYLNLTQRLNIAIDVASALDYLHHHGQTPIVHCDLKPSNILLDNDMSAHVGDFGLARFLSRKSSKNSRNSTSSMGLKGSIGYIAPEYGVGCRVSTLGDIYSYGILLLEMFTGKRPVDDIFKKGLNLHTYVETAFPEQIMSIIDPQLSSEEECEDASDETVGGTGRTRMEDCLVSVIRVGLLCSKESPRERMEMEDVSKAMCEIRNTFLGVGTRKPTRKREYNLNVRRLL